ncbi:unnamed protein product [Thlaspi arvense]|uniref:N-acetyltransferase domain-containing protein n=1 Tax=Thlaspi arvense TaxID=13288 RepID=A0AAU9RUF2_THLAR|nr:unnamed protein product [Thlaspi arvense]
MEEILISSNSHEESDNVFSQISLRPFDLSDVDDFMEAAAKYIAEVAIPHPWLRAICIGNRAVGAISVAPGTGGDRCRGELGYVLASEYWGKGIVTRAVRMVASSIFLEWPHMERLEALVDVNNKGSQRVLEKVGFVREGVLRKYFFQKGKARDMVMFSLLSTDPLVN